MKTNTHQQTPSRHRLSEYIAKQVAGAFIVTLALSCAFSTKPAVSEVLDVEGADLLSLGFTPQYVQVFHTKDYNTNYQADFSGLATLYSGHTVEVGRGRLVVYLPRTETTGGKSTNQMSRDAGLTWPVNDADAPTPQNDIEILALQQYFLEDDLELISGRLLYSSPNPRD